MNIAKVLSELCEEELGISKKSKISDILGVNQANFSTYLQNSSAGEGVSKKMIKNLIAEVIRHKGLSSVNMMEIISDKIDKEFGITSINQKSKILGVSPPNLYNYLNWNNFGRAVAERALSKFTEETRNRIFENHIIPIYELKKIKPRKYGSTFLIHEEDSLQESFRLNLSGKKGIYAFYNSQAKLIYIGKTNSDLYKEISQQLGREVYVVEENFQEKKLKQGQITAYLSSYEITNSLLVDDIEALIIRITYNTNLNDKIEPISSVKRKHGA